MAATCAVARATPEQAASSDAFVDSIGINIHAAHTTGPYGDWTAIEQDMSDLGIRNVRDIPDDYTKLNQLVAATGVKVDLIMQDGETTPDSIDMDMLPVVMQRAEMVNNVNLLEGPNERDNFDNWEQPLLQWQSALYQAVKADPAFTNIPMLAPSLGPYWTPDTLPQLNNYVDAGNIHSYPPFGAWLSNYLAFRMQSASNFSGTKPIYATETGIHNAIGAPYNPNNSWPGVSETAAARYYPQGLMEFFRQGVVKTYIYELAQEIDDPTNTSIEANLGLVRADMSKKPAYYAIKNTIDLLKDPGPNFSAAALDVTIGGGDANLHHLILQKRDGSFYIGLWQDNVYFYDQATKTDIYPPSENITLSLPNAASGASLYYPTESTDPTAYTGSLSQLTLAVPGELLLLKLNFSDQTVRTWNASAAGDWNSGSNWVIGAPNAVGAQAYFGATSSSSQTIINNAATTTLGMLTFNSPNSYHLSGAANLVMQVATGSATVNVQQGSHEIGLPLTIASNTTLNIASGATLQISQPVTVSSGQSLSQTGGGAVNYTSSVTLQGNSLMTVIASQHLAALSIGDHAKLTMSQSTGGSVLRTDSLGISSAGGKLDLTNNKMIISAMVAGTWNGSGYTGVAGMVASARHGGDWNGTAGITTSLAAAASGISTLAVASAGELGKSTFAGQSILPSDMLVMYTFNGDANLSGTIDADDYFAIDSHYGYSGTVFGFAQGDFNYDGRIDGDDYFLIDQAYSAEKSGFSLAPPVALTSVPEPAFTMSLIGAGLLFRRSRRGMIRSRHRA